MWRAFAVALVVAAVLGSGATANGLRVATSCGSATPVDPSAPLGRAVPLGDVFWFGIYPFKPGYPTKAIVMAQRPIDRPVVIRGWNCASGRSLRFWYRDEPPLIRVPTTIAKLRRTGTLRASFGPWPTGAMRGGYFMFWRSGPWKIVAYQAGRRIGSAIVQAASD
jgi:hypothetical protein